MDTDTIKVRASWKPPPVIETAQSSAPTGYHIGSTHWKSYLYALSFSSSFIIHVPLALPLCHLRSLIFYLFIYFAFALLLFILFLFTSLWLLRFCCLSFLLYGSSPFFSSIFVVGVPFVFTISACVISAVERRSVSLFSRNALSPRQQRAQMRRQNSAQLLYTWRKNYINRNPFKRKFKTDGNCWDWLAAISTTSIIQLRIYTTRQLLFW